MHQKEITSLIEFDFVFDYRLPQIRKLFLDIRVGYILLKSIKQKKKTQAVSKGFYLKKINIGLPLMLSCNLL